MMENITIDMNKSEKKWDTMLPPRLSIYGESVTHRVSSKKGSMDVRISFLMLKSNVNDEIQI